MDDLPLYKQYPSEYNSWNALKGRCNNPNHPQYADYGGRGITVRKEWEESFDRFFKDMGPKPSPNHTIERKNNDKGYYKRNCKWADRFEQGRNRRNNFWVSFNGENLIVAEFSKKINASDRVVKYHLKNKRTAEWIAERFSKKTKKQAPVKMIEYNGMLLSQVRWANKLSVKPDTLRKFLLRHPFEAAIKKYSKNEV
jgi:hypothetical protein